MKKNLIFSLLVMTILMVGVVSANTVGSSTIVFEGPLTDNDDGSYSGIIPAVEDGGFDIFAEEGATAVFTDDNNDDGIAETNTLTISDHDAFLPNPDWNPDTPDWYQYSLEFDGNNWALRNHPGATEVDPWYNDPMSYPARGIPMSGEINWDNMYATEDDMGTYISGTGTPEIDDGLGGAQAWDMDWSWGSEYVPLEYPGFDVNIVDNEDGTYVITMTPFEDDEDPEISNPIVPQHPRTTEEVEICADVTDDSDISNVRLDCTSTSHGFQSYSMTNTEGDQYCEDEIHMDWNDNEQMSCTITATDEYDNSFTETIPEFTYDGEAPTADAGEDQIVDEGEEVTFDGSGSEDSVTAPEDLVYTWNFGDESPVESEVGLIAPTHTYADNGEYTVTLTVEDESGFVSDPDTMTVTVNDLEPTADLTGDAILYLGESGSWDASDSTSNPDEIIKYEWDWNYDGSDFIASGDEDIIQTHTYESPGNYVVAVRVTDDDGSISEPATLGIEVREIILENLPASENAVINQEFTFDVGALEIPPGILTYSLVAEEFPEGMTIDSSTGEINWIPTKKGQYSAKVEISDGEVSIQGILTIEVYDYNITLVEGWNLISIPLVPEDTSIDEVLGEVSSNADVIWAYVYNEETGKNVWKYNEPEEIGWNKERTLQNIIPGYGYYIKMNDAVVVYRDGEKMYDNDEFTAPKPPVVTLTPSWNLIGHYGMNTDVSKEEALDTLGESYSTMLDMDGNPISDETNLNPTQGYWLFVTGTDNLDYAPSEEAYSKTV